MPRETVRRYRGLHYFKSMLHELKLMRDRGEIKLRPGINDTQFEEMIKKIDKHFSDNGVEMNHPLVRGMVDDTDSIKCLTNFFKHVYATNLSPRQRAIVLQGLRTQNTLNRLRGQLRTANRTRTRTNRSRSTSRNRTPVRTSNRSTM